MVCLVRLISDLPRYMRLNDVLRSVCGYGGNNVEVSLELMSLAHAHACYTGISGGTEVTSVASSRFGHYCLSPR